MENTAVNGCKSGGARGVFYNEEFFLAGGGVIRQTVWLYGLRLVNWNLLGLKLNQKLFLWSRTLRDTRTDWR